SIDLVTGAVTYTPAADFASTCFIRVRFDDQNPTDNIVEDEFMVTVNPVNDAPVVSSNCATSHPEDSAYSCSPGVTDPDAGDSHTWALDASNTCTWASIDPVTGEITGTPHDDHVGSCLLAFVANDALVDSAVASHTVEVTNIQPTLSIADT